MLSEVPEGWGESALQELCYRPISYGVLKPGDYAKGGRPMLRIQDVKTNFEPSLIWRISSELDEEYRRTRLNEGDIVFSVVGTLGEVKEIDSKLAGANISRAFAVIGADKEKICLSYLLQFLKGSQVSGWVAQTGRGGAQKVVNLGELRALSVPLPPLNEQHRIAEILASVDASIQATQAVIEQAERVKRGLMEELLTGGLGSEAIERGEVPEGWLPHAPISSYVKNKTVKWNECESLPYIGLEHIEQHSGRLLGFGESEDVTSAKNVFEEGDVLFGKLRPNLRKYWKADRRGICSTDILVLQTYTGMLEGYLFAIVQSEPFLIFAENDAAGTKMPRTSWKRLETIELPLPPLKEQQRIVQILSDIDELIVRQKAINEQQAHTKRGLMDDLLTGKVRTV